MSAPPNPITGRCLCGGVTYSATAEPVVQAVCHCTDCQPQVAFLKAGSLDDASWLEPGVEVWTSSAQPWSPQFEQTTRMERGPQ